MHDLYTHTGEDALRRAVAALPAVIDVDAPRAALPYSHMVEAGPIRELVEKLTPRNATKIRTQLLDRLN